MSIVGGTLTPNTRRRNGYTGTRRNGMSGVKNVSEERIRDEIDEGPSVAVSDNIFADLGLPNPEEYDARVQLALAVRRLIKEHGMTQKVAAVRSGIKQSDLSNIVNGHLDGISMERLTNVLNHLDQDVVVQVQPMRGERGRTYVCSPESAPVFAMAASGRRE